MLRLIFSELASHARLWFGGLTVTTTAAAIGALAASLIETGAQLGGESFMGLVSMSSVVIAFTSVTAMIVLGAVATLTVNLNQRNYALWQLVGIRPAAITVVVLTQLTMVALLGSVLGCLIATPLKQPIFEALFGSWAVLEGVTLVFGPLSWLGVTAAITTIMLISGLRGARRAARVEPIEVLREPNPPELRLGWFRWVLAGLSVAAIVGFILGVRGTELNQMATPILFFGPLVAALIATLGPLLFPLVLRAWTSLVPPRASASWFLARNSARYKLGQSTAAISPLMVATALAGSLYTAGGTLGNAIEVTTGRNSFSMPIESTIVMLGGPLLLSAVGAAVIIFMSSRAREREFALVQAAGGTHPTIARASVWEAVIYVVTGALLAALAILASGVFAALALSAVAPGTMPSFGVVPAAVVGGAGLLLVLLATVIPTLVALRRDVPRALAVE